MIKSNQPRIGDLATARLAQSSHGDDILQGVVIRDNYDGTMQMRVAIDKYPSGMYAPGKQPPFERTFIGPEGATRVDDSSLFGWAEELVRAARGDRGIK